MKNTKRQVIAAGMMALAIAAAGCATGGSSRPVVPVGPVVPIAPSHPEVVPVATRAIAAVVMQAGSQTPAAGLDAKLTDAGTGQAFHCQVDPCRTNQDGFVLFDPVTIGADVVLELTGQGWVAGRFTFTLTATQSDVQVAAVREVPPAAPAANSDELHNVQANFCNLPAPGPTGKGAPMFTVFYISLGQEDRQAWLKAQAAAGATHFVLSPQAGYPGAAFADRNLYDQPDVFAAYIREVMAAPGANGKGFTPIIILDGGEPGIRDRITRFWPGIRAALGADADRVLVVPGWELVNASAATSADLSFALKELGREGWPHIWVHLSPRRGAGSSNPGESDDPWRMWSWPVRNADGSLVMEDDGQGGQRVKFDTGRGIGDAAEADKLAHPDPMGTWGGAESPFWKMAGGELAEGLLYQSEAVRGNDDQCDAARADCWKNRWEDIVPRLAAGMNGWRILGGGKQVGLVFFEGPAYYFFRGQTDMAFAVRIANQARAMCDKYRVVCGFGNGIPDKRQPEPEPVVFPWRLAWM